MEVGDLVKIASWCKNKNRLAIIIEEYWWDEKQVRIQYIDEEGMKEDAGKALKANLVLVEGA